MLALLVACLGAAAPLDESAEPLRVWLDGHQGALDLAGDAPVLRFRALAHSRLPVEVEAVEVGVLFAKEGEALTAELGPLYGSPPDDGERAVGAVRRWIDVLLGPGAEEKVLVEAPLAPGDPEPVHWLTHVLGYRLADVSLPLLRELLSSDVFADEAAVVETLALAGTVARKREVRERWGARAELIEALAELASAPVPADPSLQVVLERVMAIRALGVLGGERARETLKALLRDERQAALTEPLLVMSIARLRSPLEVPMAHAVPPGARRIADVVAAALDDVEGWTDPEPEPVTPEPVPPPAESVRPLWVVALVALGIVLVSMVLVVLRLRRHQHGD